MSKEFFEAKNAKQLCKILGLPPEDAGRVEMRRDLVIAIRRSIQDNGWTHAEAANIAGVGRTVITAIVNGNIGRISTDKLIDVAHHVGLKIKLKVA